MRIGISGYQSIKKAIIDVEDGQIVGITGENATGKSAVARSIRAFVINQSSNKDFINVDLKRVKVVIKTDRGQYQWDKNEKEASYSLGDNKLRKINRAPLEDVFPGSGFLVEKEGSEIWTPSIVAENEEIFPFNVPPSIAFKIFSRFISTPKIGVIIKELKDLVKEDKVSLEKTKIKLNLVESDLSLTLGKRRGLPDREILVRVKNRIESIQLAKLKLVRWKEMIGRVGDKEFLEKSLLKVSGDRVRDLRCRVEKHSEELGSLSVVKIKLKNLETLLYTKERQEKDLNSYIKFIEVNRIRVEKMQEAVDFINFKAPVLWKVTEVKEEFMRSLKEVDIQKEALKEFKFCPLCERSF